ncbi:hypothetical protein [Paenibacillus sp. 32O-W]|uniref:hypothetical protein n=1 Tax=Paenibacillus sp. 32O-W TaxID=1695218 RepID=UPI001C930935|nr:hypothetical protein [Paenibacillus sp. 32O-W]
MLLLTGLLVSAGYILFFAVLGHLGQVYLKDNIARRSPVSGQPVHRVNSSEERESAERLTIISIPGLSFLELREPSLRVMPELSRLLQEGVLGAVNARLAGQGGKDSYASIGAGRRSVSGGAQGYNRWETVEEVPADVLYQRYTGRPSGKEAIFVPAIEGLASTNRATSYGGRPGSLGDILGRNQVQTNVWGNADIVSEADPAKGLQRYAPLALMNLEGTVAQGDVSRSLLRSSPWRAGGVSTDYSAILDQWKQRDNRSVTLIELGDLQRLYAVRSFYSEESFAAQMQDVLKEMDSFIGNVRREIADKEDLWILSPVVHSDAAKRKLTMAPWIMHRNDGGRGLIYTESTRRDGVAVMWDLTPSVTERLGLAGAAEWTGKAVQIKPHADPLAYLLGEIGRMEAVYRVRLPLLSVFTVYEIGVLLIGLYYALSRKKEGRPLVRGLLWSIPAAPLLLFALGPGLNGTLSIHGPKPGVGGLSLASAEGTALWNAAQIALLPVVLAAISLWLVRRSLWAGCTWIGLATAAVLMLDGWTGANVMKRSVLGYDPIIGARFYGIGNELMGVLVGAAVLGTMAWAQQRQSLPAGSMPGSASVAAGRSGRPKRPASPTAARSGRAIGPTAPAADRLFRWGLAALYVALLIYLASPVGGANAGGAITAAVTCGAAWFGLRRGERWSSPLSAWPEKPSLRGGGRMPKTGAGAVRYLGPPIPLRNLPVLRETPRSGQPELAHTDRASIGRQLGLGQYVLTVSGGEEFGRATSRSGKPVPKQPGHEFQARGMKLRTAVLLGLLLVGGILVLWVANVWFKGGQHSHIGEAFRYLAAGDLAEIKDILVRKLKMNVHLLRASIWSKVVLTCVLVMLAILVKPPRRFRRWRRLYPAFLNGWAAITIGTVTAFLFNDSGIVAAGTMMTYAAVPLLLLSLEEQVEESSDG